MENQYFKETKEELKKIIIDDLHIPIELEEIEDNVSLYDEGLGLDSISIINFIVLIEKKFKIDFSSTEISGETFGCIDNLAAFISTKMNSEMKGA